MDDALDLRARFSDLPPLQSLRVLDLFCGTRTSDIGKQLPAMPFLALAGVDMNEAYLNITRATSHSALSTEYFLMDARKVAKHFPPKHFDVALVLDGLEHLKKRHGVKLLRSLEGLTRHRIMIWIPLGDTVGYYSLQIGADRKAKGLETHRSAWYEADLTRLGYRVTVYPAYHRHLTPPADAAWAIKDL